MRTVHHQGPRLVCKVCGKRFQRSDYLKKHYKKAHNVEQSSSAVGEWQAALDESPRGNTGNPWNFLMPRETNEEPLNS